MIIAYDAYGMFRPGFGAVSDRAGQQRLQRLRGTRVAGPVVPWWFKRRFRCVNPACVRSALTERTPQVP